MICGTPVMAFEVGGMPEMAMNDYCGWLVKDITLKGISQRLNSVSKEPNLETYGLNAYERAKILFNKQNIAKKYISHFKFSSDSSICRNSNNLA